MAGFIDNSFDAALAAGKAADDAAAAAKAAEAAAAAAKQTADDVAASVANAAAAAKQAADDVAASAAAASKQTIDDATANAAAAAKKITDDAIAKIDEIIKNNPTTAAKLEKSPTLREFIAKNPGYTAVAAGIAIFGAVIFANALLMYEEEIKLSIVTMKILDETKPTIVQIIYEPATKIAKGDELTIIGNTNIIPDSIINKKLDFDDIISKTEINVNIPDLITPATYGSLELKKDLDNCFKEAADNAAKDFDDATGNFFSEFYEKFKTAIIITVTVILAILFFFGVMKVIKSFNS